MKKKLLKYVQFTGLLLLSGVSYAKTIVAIDAGHGGKDRGATGQFLQLKEKDITLSIAKELKALLDADPKFKTVMVRKSDTFIELATRTEIARKNKANYLVSIHADSIPQKPTLKGAVVWVLSNRRANDELGKWLEGHERQSELLGGTGSLLAESNEKYLSQTVLDLQFSHAQRSGYELGRTVLNHLEKIGDVAKKEPQPASFSVLRSPDIPSILVETGFISNQEDERKLGTKKYRHQIAQAIYKALIEYNRTYPPATTTATESVDDEDKQLHKDNVAKKKKTVAQKKKQNVKKVINSTKETKNSGAIYHVVEKDQTLYAIARMYNTTPEKLAKLNNLKSNKIIVGKKLKVKAN